MEGSKKKGHPYRLDRSAFKKQTFEEASHQLEYWKKKKVEERLQAANYLIGVAFQLIISWWEDML